MATIDPQHGRRRLDQAGLGIALHLAAKQVLAVDGQIPQADIANAFGLRLSHGIGHRSRLAQARAAALQGGQAQLIDVLQCHSHCLRPVCHIG